jgi:hypothetical protein
LAKKTFSSKQNCYYTPSNQSQACLGSEPLIVTAALVDTKKNPFFRLKNFATKALFGELSLLSGSSFPHRAGHFIRLRRTDLPPSGSFFADGTPR